MKTRINPQTQVNFIVAPTEGSSSFPLAVPPTPRSSLPPQLPILVAQLIGCPIRHLDVNPGWNGERVVAIRVSPEPGMLQGTASPMCMPTRRRRMTTAYTIPVPVYNSFNPYPSYFIQVMREWVTHLLNWCESGDQSTWYLTGERLIKDVLSEARNLHDWSDTDQSAMEYLLMTSLTLPRRFVSIGGER